MPYERLNLKNGQVFSAEHLVHMEKGIEAANESAAAAVNLTAAAATSASAALSQAAAAATSAADAAKSAANADEKASILGGDKAAHQQLVTDKDGNTAWVERLAWKEVTTEKGYAYIYQDAEMVAMDGRYQLPAPPVSSPVAGETYTIIIGGNEYTSKCVDISAFAVGQEAYVFGNTAMTDDDFPLENPAPDATYLILLVPGGSDGFYGTAVFADPVDSPVLTIRSAAEVETTTTDIKKVDRELLDVPTPDMDALEGEEGHIANRPCWAYEIPGGWIVWDGETEGKEILSVTVNGTTQILGYKVCPVPLNKYSFDKGGAYFPIFVQNDAGESQSSWILSKMEMFLAPCLYGLYASGDTSGAPKYISYDKEKTGNFLGEIDGSAGIYIATDWAAQYPHIKFALDAIYKPLDAEVLPPPDNLNGVYYYRWSQTARSWQPVTIDQLKADLGLTETTTATTGE